MMTDNTVETTKPELTETEQAAFDAASKSAPIAGMPKTADDVEAVYFEPADLEKGFALVQHITSLPYKPIPNFDPETYQFDGSAGLLVMPQKETVVTKDSKGEEKKERVLKRIIIAAVPTLDTMLSHPKGKDYIQDSVIASFSAKLRNAFVRVTNDEKAIADGSLKLPLSVDSFIEKSEKGAQDQGLSSFNTLANDIVKSLADKGITLNKALLRQVLQSTEFAKALLPSVSQAVWGKVLNGAKIAAEKKALKVDIFDHWIATRDSYKIEANISDDVEFTF